jgi:hypothetical protein
MDKVIRVFKRLREGQYEQAFEFTTGDIIFDAVQVNSDKPLGKLLKYLNYIFIHGLPDPAGFEACSRTKTPIPKEIKKVDKKFVRFVGEKWQGNPKHQHMFVEQSFWNNDPQCLATELPLFLEPNQTPTNKGWLGFLDILRVDEGKIQLLDYKPNANKEGVCVGPQLYRYLYMLHRQTGIPIEKFEAYYFDRKNCYQVLI